MRSIYMLALALLVVQTACTSLPTTPDVRDVVPGISFEEFKLMDLDPDKKLTEQTLRIHLTFVFRNPYTKPLPIPSHAFNFSMNGTALPIGLSQNHDNVLPDGTMAPFTIPAQGESRRIYPLAFSLDPQADLSAFNVFGKINLLRFESVFKIDLTEFADEMFNVGDLLQNPAQQEAYALLKEMLKQQLGDKTFTLSHETSIKVPSPPKVTFSEGRPLKFQFVGEMESLSLKPVRDAMQPMVDLLDNVKNVNVTAPMPPEPFLDMMNGRVTRQNLPPPLKPLFPQGVDELSQEEFLLDYVAAKLPGLEAVHSNWTQFKQKFVPPSGTSPLNHTLSSFGPANANPEVAWNTFKQKWEDFGDRVKFPDELQFPGSRVTGIEIVIPFRMKNTNSFPITAPSATTAATVSDTESLHFHAGPQQETVVLGPNEEKDMQIITRVSFVALQNGFKDLVTGSEIRPNLQGRVSVDMGYGPMRVEFDAQDMLFKMNK